MLNLTIKHCPHTILKTCAVSLEINTCQIIHIRRIHTQERSRFPSRLKYWDIFALVQTSGNISLIAERDDSGHRTTHAWYQALPLFWYTRLEWWDRKYQDYLLERSHIRRDANNHANSQIIARCIAICSAMLIAIISEIVMSTLVKISRFRSQCKNWDLFPAKKNLCECHYSCT